MLATATVRAQPPAASSSLAAAPAPTNSMSGDELVANVVVQLERRERISARVLLQASLGGRLLQMGGPEFESCYCQQWNASRDKLLVLCDLRGHVEGTPIRLLQVSDGDRMWTDRTTPTGRNVSRVDLRYIRREIDQLADASHELPAGQAGVLPIQIELLAERGGLPSLLAGLSESFNFSPPASLRLADVPVAGTIGTWKEDKLAAIHPAAAAEQHETEEGGVHLPPRLPASVMLLVGQDDLFPYVIEFRTSEDTGPLVPGDLSVYQMRPRPLMVVHFYERSFTAELEPGRFEYSPGDADWADLTAVRLDRLRQASGPQSVAVEGDPPPKR